MGHQEQPEMLLPEVPRHPMWEPDTSYGSQASRRLKQEIAKRLTPFDGRSHVSMPIEFCAFAYGVAERSGGTEQEMIGQVVWQRLRLDHINRARVEGIRLANGGFPTRANDLLVASIESGLAVVERLCDQFVHAIAGF